MDWHAFDFHRLADHLRTTCQPSEADSMVWAFEEAIECARRDAELLPHLLAATTCLIARAEGSSPRTVLETYFRRAVSDENWRERYLPLFE